MRVARGACALAMVGLLLSCQASAGSQVAGATPSPTAGATPSPTGKGGPTIYLPTDVQLSAPSARVVWALVANTLLFVSTDGGNNWTQRSLPPAGLPPSIAFVDESEGWLLTTGSPETQCNSESVSIWHTTDGAATWNQLPAHGIADVQCKKNISFADSRHGFFTAWDDNHRPTVYRTSDGGLTWAGSTLPDPPGFVTEAGGFALQAGSVRSFDGRLLVAAYGNQNEYVFGSRDAGATWTYVSSSNAVPENVTFVTNLRWLKVGNDGSGFETVDGGRSWHAWKSDYSDAAGVASAFVFADARVGYGTVRGWIYQTLDGGAHWTRLETPGVFWPG